MGNIREFAGCRFEEVEEGIYKPMDVCTIPTATWYRTKDCIGLNAIAVRTGRPPVIDIRVVSTSDKYFRLREIYDSDYSGVENISIGYEVVDWERSVRGVRA